MQRRNRRRRSSRHPPPRCAAHGSAPRRDRRQSLWPNRSRPATAPRRFARSHRPVGRRTERPSAASAPHGGAGTAPEARRADRRRRRTQRPDRGRGRGRRRPRWSRRRPEHSAADRQEPPVTLGWAEVGGQRHVPPGAQRRGQCGVQPFQVAGIRNDQQRAGPAAQRTAAASANRAGQSSPGTACHTARAARRAATAVRKAVPAVYRAQPGPEPPSRRGQIRARSARGRRSHRGDRAGSRLDREQPGRWSAERGRVDRLGQHRATVRGGTPGVTSGVTSRVCSASTRACRGGTASRSTSATEPAYRSATARASSATSADSTGSADTTRSTKPSRPGWSDSASRSSTYPPTAARRTGPGPGHRAEPTHCPARRPDSRRAGPGGPAGHRPAPVRPAAPRRRPAPRPPPRGQHGRGPHLHRSPGGATASRGRRHALMDIRRHRHRRPRPAEPRRAVTPHGRWPSRRSAPAMPATDRADQVVDIRRTRFRPASIRAVEMIRAAVRCPGPT